MYCERKTYEAPNRLGRREEWDDHDGRASRFIVLDRAERRWQGAARLVSNRAAPVPAHALGAIDWRMAKKIDNGPYAEVSRLCSLETGETSGSARWALLKSAIAGVTEYSLDHDIDHLLFLVTPALRRVLRALDIPMTGCGPTIEHRGRRRAYLVDLQEAVDCASWLRLKLAGGAACASHSNANVPAFYCHAAGPHHSASEHNVENPLKNWQRGRVHHLPTRPGQRGPSSLERSGQRIPHHGASNTARLNGASISVLKHEKTA